MLLVTQLVFATRHGCDFATGYSFHILASKSFWAKALESMAVHWTPQSITEFVSIQKSVKQ
jgi:hypothetical protein